MAHKNSTAACTVSTSRKNPTPRTHKLLRFAPPRAGGTPVVLGAIPWTRRWAAGMLTIVALTCTVTAFACDLPVFRWALENWAADPYEIIIYHDGALDDDQQQLVDHLRSGTTEESGLGNATTTLVDTTQSMDLFFQDLWKNQEAPETPWMVVRYPHAQSNPSYVWSGTLNADHIARVLDSPARQEISRRLEAEDTAVWVFLKTGDVKRDAGRQEALQAAIQAMSKTVEIVPLDIESNEEAVPVPWDLKFSLLALDRNDPLEQPFIKMLLKSEVDLSERDAPMAFPVFGRGRALYALVDGGIAPDLVEEACMYIAGRCTCEVKDQNPGIDLLMSTNWETVVGESMMAPIEPPSVAGLAAVEIESDTSKEAVPTPAAPAPSDETDEPSRTLIRNIAIAMGLGFALVIGGTLYILIKMPNRND